jgi:hypothetical protein
MWTWAVMTDGNNNIFISDAFRYNARGPTVLQVG